MTYWVFYSPDIAYIINSLAQQNASPKPRHFATAKRVLHYLAGTQNFRLSYSDGTTEEGLHAYADASWASEVGCWSVSGYTWFYGGGLISHVSKKQTTVALSSVNSEAEYMAATHVIQEGLWLHSLFTELSIPFISPIKVYLDNTGAIALSTAAKFHQRSKHIDLQYHFIHEHVGSNIFQLIWVPLHKNIADILTKPLPCPTFHKFLRMLGITA